MLFRSMLSSCGESFYRRSRIVKAVFCSGCTPCVLHRPPSPGSSVSASLSRTDRIRMHRTSGNKQGNACHISRKRCNRSGGLSDGCSYYLPFSIDSIARNISYITCGTIALPYAFIDSCRHFEKAIPSNLVEIPSSRLQTGD